MPAKNNRFAVKRTTRGLGLIALRPIPNGRRIIEYIGPVLTGDEVHKKGGQYLFELDENHSIDGSSRENTARYLNHSCRPNAEAYVSASGKRIWIWARKNIKAGDEITIDYGKEYFDRFIKPKGCKCEKCVAKKS